MGNWWKVLSWLMMFRYGRKCVKHCPFLLILFWNILDQPDSARLLPVVSFVGSIQAESAGWLVLQGRAQEGQGATMTPGYPELLKMKRACQRQPMHGFIWGFILSHECLWRAETSDCSDQSLPSTACHDGIDTGIPGQGDGVETHSWHLPPWFAPKSPAKQRGGGEDKFCEPCTCFCKSVCLHSWGQDS